MTNLTGEGIVDKLLALQQQFHLLDGTPGKVYLNPLMCKFRWIRRSRRKRQDKKLRKKHGPKLACCSREVMKVKGMGLFMCEHMIKEFVKQGGGKYVEPAGRWV